MKLEDSRLESGKALKVTAALALQGALQIVQLKEGRGPGAGGQNSQPGFYARGAGLHRAAV